MAQAATLEPYLTIARMVRDFRPLLAGHKAWLGRDLVTTRTAKPRRTVGAGSPQGRNLWDRLDWPYGRLLLVAHVERGHEVAVSRAQSGRTDTTTACPESLGRCAAQGG